MKLFGSRKNKKNTVIRPSAYTTNPIEEDETDGASVSGFNSSFGGKTAAKRPFATERELSKDVKKHRRGRRRTFAVVLASIALLALAGFAVLEIWIHAPEVETGGLNEPTTPTPSVAPSSVPSADAAATATPEPTPDESTGRLPGTYTFLALGKDDIGLNTDTIMVGKLDTQNETLDIVSVPRDTLVNVAWGNRKINGIYANAGVPGTGDIDGVMDGLQDILGFPLDNYILININAFEEMVDTIGGIYYDVPRDMFYDDPGQDLHIAISAGPQLLSGENALKVVRFRVGNGGSGYANGDLGRIDTQQDFLLTAAKQMLSLGNIPNLPTLIQIAVSNVKTDLTENNLAFYAQEFLKLDADSIRFHTLPADGVTIRGGSYVSIRVDEWLDMVNDYLNPFSEEVTEKNVDILTSTNGTTFTSTTGSVPSLESFITY